MEKKIHSTLVSKNPWLSKEISRLLSIPTPKWKKSDWVAAARFLASKSPARGIINRAISDGIKKDLSEHINTVTKKRRGRPEKLTPEFAKEMLCHVETKRKILAEEKNVNPTEITDKSVAMSLGEYMYGSQNKTRYVSKDKLIKDIQQWIKYLKRKAKSG